MHPRPLKGRKFFVTQRFSIIDHQKNQNLENLTNFKTSDLLDKKNLSRFETRDVLDKINHLNCVGNSTTLNANTALKGFFYAKRDSVSARADFNRTDPNQTDRKSLFKEFLDKPARKKAYSDS